MVSVVATVHIPVQNRSASSTGMDLQGLDVGGDIDGALHSVLEDADISKYMYGNFRVLSPDMATKIANSALICFFILTTRS
jgi:hypothetical protein